jgi:phosphatidylethanolamine N-methyltransferase
MQKLYGDEIRKEAGLTKTLRTAAQNIPKKLPKNIQHEIEKLVREQNAEQQEITTTNKQEETTTTKRLDSVIKETLQKVENVLDTAGRKQQQDFSNDSYDLKISHLITSNQPNNVFTLGERLKVDWVAPKNHGSKDWIGIYKVTENPSKQLTSVGSRGKWYWIHSQEEEDTVLETKGIIVFKGDTLPWKIGTYELRYHHDGKYKVMTTSIPFEITGKIK